MSQITLDQQIPITKVRNNLATVFKDVKQKKVYYVVKNYTPEAVIVDVDYFQQLKDALHWKEIDQALELGRKEFTKLLKRKGYNPETVDEKIVKKILMLDD